MFNRVTLIAQVLVLTLTVGGAIAYADGLGSSGAIPAGTNVIGHVVADSGSTTAVTQATGSNLHAQLDTGSTTAVTQATGTNLHTVVDSGSSLAVTSLPALPAGSNVIGHVVADSGSTTAVTQATGSNLHAQIDSGSTTAVTQATGTNLHAVIDSGSTTAVTGTVTQAGDSAAAGHPVFTNNSPNIGSASAAVTVDSSGENVPTSALANRRSLMVTNNSGSVTIFCGSSAVTSTTGLPVTAGSTAQWFVGPSVTIKCITASSTADARIFELS